MKRFQKLLGLCLIGSLLAVHPISGADRSVMHKISEMVQRNPKGAALAGALLLGIAAYTWNASGEGSTLQTLQALKAYALGTPELKWKKGATAASLALAYAAHRYCKSKPVSALAAVGLLVPLYSLYKELPLVSDVLLAKAGKEVVDSHIEGYLDSLLFNRKMNLGFCEESYPGNQSFYFDDCDSYLTNKRLLEQFFIYYKREESHKKQLQECAHKVFSARGFVVQKDTAPEALEDPLRDSELEGTRRYCLEEGPFYLRYFHNSWRVNLENMSRPDLIMRYYYSWIYKLKILEKILDDSNEPELWGSTYRTYHGGDCPAAVDHMIKRYIPLVGVGENPGRNMKKAK